MNVIQTVEFLASVDGFRLGLEVASVKFDVIWANQWRHSVQEQYAFNCLLLFS